MATVLTKRQRTILGYLLDHLIPVGNGMPAAGEVGVAEYLESSCVKSVDLVRTVAKFVEQADDFSNSNHNQPFDSLSSGQRDEVLQRIEATDPDSFGELVTYAYSGYYTSPIVVALLGLDAGPPQPTGFPMKPFDPSVLDQVRQLGPLYRQV
jgi:hypothetical protein